MLKLSNILALTMRLREVTWQMNFIIYLFLPWSLVLQLHVFTKAIANKLDRMVACEIKVSTTV